MVIKSIKDNLGWGGIFFGICSILAMIIGIIDFLPQLQLTKDPILRIILSLSGFILMAVVVLAARRRDELLDLKRELRELKEAIGPVEVKLLSNYKQYGQHLAQNITNAKEIVWDTLLNKLWDPPHLTSYFGGSLKEYKRILYKRLSKGEINFRRVEMVFNRVSLERVIQQLLIHEHFPYIIRYYKAHQITFPIMNLTSFDGKAFYLGGFEVGAYSGTSPVVIYIREPKISKFYKSYWDDLWRNAIPLNEYKEINWDELRKIGSDFGLTNDRFDRMVSCVREKVNTEKENWVSNF